MFYFVLTNLALVFVYSVLESNGPPANTMVVLCGIALAFLFNNAKEILQSRRWVLLIVGTLLVEALLFYGYVQNSEFVGHMTVAAAGAVFMSSLVVAMMAISFNWAAREKRDFFVRLLAASATILNSLFLFSYLFSLLAN